MNQNVIPKILSLDDVGVGMSLAEPVLGDQGEVVLSQGVELTQALLLALRRRGISILSVLVPDTVPSDDRNVAVVVKLQMARLDRLFRKDAGQIGTAHLRSLITQYRRGVMP